MGKKKSAVLAFIVMISVMIASICIYAKAVHPILQKNSDSEYIEPYDTDPVIELNNNEPSFTSSEIVEKSYEKYGELDDLGRCTAAISCVGEDIMPTEERGNISEIKPTGWDQNKYPGIVDSDPPYLYNRCHLIAFQLTGENANEKNLVTGTRYMNTEGMEPYETEVAHYIKESGNHVMYRVTPKFSGDNLLCDGVQIEAYSVEDSGKGISFNIFCYNVQPGIIIDYKDGSNEIDKDYVIPFEETPRAEDENEENFREIPSETNRESISETNRESISETNRESISEGNRESISEGNSESISEGNSKAFSEESSEEDVKKSEPAEEYTYVGNKNSKVFHKAGCPSIDDMAEHNKEYFYGDISEPAAKYRPCHRCLGGE